MYFLYIILDGIHAHNNCECILFRPREFLLMNETLSFPASAAEKVHIGSEQRVSRLVKTAAYPTSLYMYERNKDKIIQILVYLVGLVRCSI